MMALVGHEVPFNRGRAQLKLLADLAVTTKAVERTTEALGRDILARHGQKWRTGSEGRISVLKRRHGLNRSRYQGDDGMNRWVGLAVIADNFINIGRVRSSRA
jgi:IS5 family transposase